MRRQQVLWMTILAALYLWPTASFAQDGKVARGKEVYTEQKCKLCHSIGEEGNKKGPLDDVAAKLTADDIRDWLLTPKEMTAKVSSTRKPVMKAYDKLSADDLDALIAYVLTLK